MCEIEEMLKTMIINHCYGEDFPNFFIEPAEISILKNKDLLKCLVQLLEDKRYHFYIDYLFEIAVNVNYLSIIDLLLKHLYLKSVGFDENRVEFLFKIEYLAKLSDLRFYDVFVKSFNKLSDDDQSEIYFDLDKIKNKAAMGSLLRIVELMKKNKYYDYNYIIENTKTISERLLKLERLEEHFEFMFSVEFQIESSLSRENILIEEDKVDDVLDEIYNYEVSSGKEYTLIDEKELVDSVKSKEMIIINKVKKLLRNTEIEVFFRSKVIDIGSFSTERFSLNFDLFTNETITAKEIANLFGNKSILYLSGNTKINGKDVFYENAAWYRSNEDMPEEDKVFFRHANIAKFRVYNVIKNY